MTAPLRGIAWDHPRAMGPLGATARSFAAATGVEVAWEARSLQAFGDEPVDVLARRYDLAVIDHPWAGHIAAERCFLDLATRLDPAVVADIERDSIGPSFGSYRYDGGLWALPIDAACHVAALRADLLAELAPAPPRTWEAALDLARAARAAGKSIGLPLVPVDSMMCFLSLCVACGEPAAARGERFVGRPTGRAALALLRSLRDLAHPASARDNPIAVLDRMSTTDEIVYAPLLFGYSNYSRPGFRDAPLRFAPSPSMDGAPLGGVIGGAGIAVSSACERPDDAVRYAVHVASPATQRGEYLEADGQPADRGAWTSAAAERVAPGFFAATVEALDRSYLRPRYDGFLAVQSTGGELIHEHLFGDLPADAALDQLDRLARAATDRASGPT